MKYIHKKDYPRHVGKFVGFADKKTLSSGFQGCDNLILCRIMPKTPVILVEVIPTPGFGDRVDLAWFKVLVGDQVGYVHSDYLFEFEEFKDA